MSNRVFIVLSVLVIACHITGAIIFDQLNLSCKCARVRSTFIRPSKYARVEIFPSGVACKRMEIIITLKNKDKVCVDPRAKWVNNLMKLMENVNGIQNPS
ncbi:C-X-C motif chemokine 13 [Candoia aspera]|uniref:C-X-C motif chemokine 13 n=1 Tax=Candoia aspera TaxID=51853 RepID=UPI002FD80635